MISWANHDRGADLFETHANHPGVKGLSKFSHGFVKMHEKNGNVFITDLRMDFEPS